MNHQHEQRRFAFNALRSFRETDFAKARWRTWGISGDETLELFALKAVIGMQCEVQELQEQLGETGSGKASRTQHRTRQP